MDIRAAAEAGTVSESGWSEPTAGRRSPRPSIAVTLNGSMIKAGELA